MRKYIVAVSILFSLSTLFFARGKNGITERSVNQERSWRETFDLNDKKEGKYNILVEVDDHGGNQTLGGPYNIWVDPESDLPVVGITNPAANMRIPGNLNIVGTCFDDDAVEKVELIFDGDREHPRLAQGKDFWSYYLDTTELDEGPHTIEVYGTDCNGLRGRSVSVTWNLDRRQPVTEVTNYGLGALVSGKITLKGTVFDGNGMDSLRYSIDNGKTFSNAKLRVNKKTKVASFSIPIDTRTLKDGPNVCWFKATDLMGSASVYSFLYLIDNAAPDVRIVSPERDEVMNGKFAIVGYAKDSTGVQRITWKLGDETGEFERVPGNPYFYKEVDTTGSKEKSIEFSVTATDVVGNVVTAKQTIPLNQEDDKPVVVIDYPAPDAVVDGEAGTVYVRGIASDDDGVATVMYSLDGGREHIIKAQGVFYNVLSPELDLDGGAHTVTAYAIDSYGVVGDPVSVTFHVRGNTPAFEVPQIRTDAGTQRAENGLLVNPEAHPFLETNIVSDAGLKRLAYRFEWGDKGVEETDITLPGGAPKSFFASVPLDNAPWGVVRVSVVATDLYDRTVEQKTVLHMKNLTRAYTDKPEVIFSDSCVSDAGDIINHGAGICASGYFVGGTAASVQLIPPTPFATAELNGNSIVLHGTDVAGTSAPVRVRVTTDQGVSYDSRPLVFHSDNPAPIVKIDDAEHNRPYDGNSAIHISGTVQSDVPLTRFGYRILRANAQVSGDIVMDVDTLPVSFAGINTVSVKDGAFSFDVEPYHFVRGLYVIEVVAENGKQGADAVFVRKLPDLPALALDGVKKAVANPPVVSWFDGVDVYYTTTYQGEVDRVCGVFSRDDLLPGVHELTVSGKTAQGKSYSSKYTARKEGGVSVSLQSVGGEPYASGMNVELARGASVQEGGGKQLVAAITSEYPVTAVFYEISGEAAPGGKVTSAGKATNITALDEKHFEATIPLENLPSRVTTVKVIADTQKGSGSYQGTINVVRPHDADRIDEARKFYWLPQENALFNEELNGYSLARGTTFGGYANMPLPVTASLVSASANLNVIADGNNIAVAATRDGFYRNVTLRLRDGQGVEYLSEPVNLLFDARLPDVTIASPAAHQWVQNSIALDVRATDESGIEKVEWSIDGGENWTAFTRHGSSSDSYMAQVDIAAEADGLIKLDVRATDSAGRVRRVGTAVQKDTVPPEVKVLIPCADDIVNGENTIAFSVKDGGRVAAVEYRAPPAGVPVNPLAIPLDPVIHTQVGTQDKPIHDLMSFTFRDGAGNETAIRSWDFIIDQESDLPVAEVNLPEENAIITRDFTISGVIVDDDGPSKLWYKIDDQPFRALSDYGTSFSIDVPLATMTDNEHSVTVYAEDVNGVKGHEYVRNFRISLEEPKGQVLAPPITETVKDVVTINGRATDKNGIKAVYISIDNGNSYNEAVGNFGHECIDTPWEYTFDTHVVQDGTHVVFLKIIDWYDIEGLYSTLINIDNTSPDIQLELPLDGSISTGNVFFSGQTTDNIALTDLHIAIRSLDGKTVSSALARTDLEVSTIITQVLDLSALENGFYNIELVGMDAAENITRVSRNITLDKHAPKAKVDLLYPLNGESVRGVFNIYGTATSEIGIDKLVLYVDGKETAETELSSAGYYKFQLRPDLISEGQHTVRVRALLSDATTIVSPEQYLHYTSFGPWVTIDNFTYGDFAVERPYLRGEAGYTIPEDELVAAKMKGSTKEAKALVEAKSVQKVELSLDNGKTFKQISSNGKWRYRIENKDIAEGYHFLLLRATMKNGEMAITRTIVQVDNTPPTIKLISPGAGGRYNQELVFSGLTNDDVALKDVRLYLRKGDKAWYEVPQFIRGLYFDWQFWGATLFNIGMGLTFFDDNVKLQVQWGQFTESQRSLFSSTQGRYGGNSVLGIKLLANVYYLPFRYLFGPDWEWLSLNVAVGANFSRFNNSDIPGKEPMILSAALVQLEFPRVTFAKQKMFRTMSFYTEGQFWFLPSDVAARVFAPQISFGLRVNVF